MDVRRRRYVATSRRHGKASRVAAAGRSDFETLGPRRQRTFTHEILFRRPACRPPLQLKR